MFHQLDRIQSQRKNLWTSEKKIKGGQTKECKDNIEIHFYFSLM